jgi:hypothetical protein
MTTARLSLLLLLAAGCGEGTVVDVEPVPADYTEWFRLDSVGPVPGHGDTYRIIYANDQARTRGTTVVGTYPQGSIIVKEVHERDGDQPGDLKYIGIMRMLAAAPSGAELHSLTGDDEGWLFTYLADGIDSDEEYRSSCWGACHQAAPIDGTFYDYGK